MLKSIRKTPFDSPFKFLLGAIILIQACAHSTIIPFQNDTKAEKAYPAKLSSEVGIYRSTHPFQNFIELGLISYRSPQFHLDSLYEQLRKDAAEYGADAVIDVKTSYEKHVEMVMNQNCVSNTACDANGNCSPQESCFPEMVPEERITYLITGSMIRRKQ